MRPNNRQRSRGGRSGGGGGGHHHKQHHNNNPNRPPNRNQIYDSSGPDVRVRGNAHQVFDKYQALAREAAASGERIMAEAYWQYADHYYRLIQAAGGFTPRNNQGWGEGEEGQAPQQQGQGGGQPHANGDGGGAGPGPGPGNGGGQSSRERTPREDSGADPGLGGVAFLQNGRTAAPAADPSMDDQPEVPEFAPAGGGRGRG